MTLTELKYIIAVARERHFGRAAESCFISQPSLSVAVRKLEEELGVHIFERRSQEVSLTPVGESIVEQAQKVLDDVRRIEELAVQGKDPLCGPLRLGAIFTMAAPFCCCKYIPYFCKNLLIFTSCFLGCTDYLFAWMNLTFILGDGIWVRWLKKSAMLIMPNYLKC